VRPHAAVRRVKNGPQTRTVSSKFQPIWPARSFVCGMRISNSFFSPPIIIYSVACADVSPIVFLLVTSLPSLPSDDKK
jgi:hypothetical protein